MTCLIGTDRLACSVESLLVTCDAGAVVVMQVFVFKAIAVLSVKMLPGRKHRYGNFPSRLQRDFKFRTQRQSRWD